MAKLRVGLVFGGKSGEHEVSVRSAAAIYRALDKNKYEVRLLGIDKEGGWHVVKQNWLPAGTQMKSLPSGEKTIVPHEEKVDVFFPIVHGSFGEDGCLQGLLELADAAYVGAGVLGSAVGMDKDVQKRLLMQADIPVAKYQVWEGKMKLKYPVFVKPANMGSSVGISKVSNQSKSKFKKALGEAFKYDMKIVVEEAIEGRELEVAVLGNERPAASLPGEVIPKGHEFYDYEAKYIDEDGAQLDIPAKNLGKNKIEEIRKLAIKTYQTLACEGMARVDMFLRPDGEIVVNEINTLPGFTSISMYPKLWEATGLNYGDLLDRLIELAMEKHTHKLRLVRSYE